MPSVWSYQKPKGSENSTSYPYKGVKGTCQYSLSKTVASPSSWSQLLGTLTTTTGLAAQVAAMQNAILQTGTLSVAIDAGKMSFQLYKSGVYSETTCSKTNLNHAVAIIGWGTYNGVNCWIVRNSWGTGWGQSGYIWMQRGVNQCGIESMVFTVVAA